jgi:hypothetical protein
LLASTDAVRARPRLASAWPERGPGAPGTSADTEARAAGMPDAHSQIRSPAREHAHKGSLAHGRHSGPLPLAAHACQMTLSVPLALARAASRVYAHSKYASITGVKGGLMLIIIAGSVILGGVGLAALYDWRARRRGWTVRPSTGGAFRPAACQGRYRPPDRRQSWQDRRPYCRVPPDD